MFDKKLANLTKAVLYIAINAKPNAIRATDINKALKLPPRSLEADLQKLSKDGVLRSVRGPKGGYILGRERRNINIKDIYISVFGCDESIGFLKPAMRAFEAELEKITIELLYKNFDNSVTSAKEKVDFDI